MPLPKPPAARATILSPADFDAQAAPRPARKPTRATAPAPLTLRSDTPATAARWRTGE